MSVDVIDEGLVEFRPRFGDFLHDRSLFGGRLFGFCRFLLAACRKTERKQDQQQSMDSHNDSLGVENADVGFDSTPLP